MRSFASMCCCALIAASVSCGGPKIPERFKLDITPEIAHADSMRSLLNSLHDQLRAEGVAAVKNELAALDERLEEFKDGSIGEKNRGTYDTIIEKLKSLATTVQTQKVAPLAVDEAVQELMSLADQLPKSAAASEKS